MAWWENIRRWSNPLVARREARRWRTADEVVALSERLQNIADEELQLRSRELSWQAKSGQPLDRLLPEAYSLVREAARREFGFCHFPVQIVGGIALFEGFIAEMQTGEGKTLTCTLPAFLRAITGRGCHVITVNDYLAQRDAEKMGRLFARLGLSTGCIIAEMKDDARHAAYSSDITYTTAKEAGFDFLRDRLKRQSTDSGTAPRWKNHWPRQAAGDGVADFDPETTPVHREFHAALIDEADSILLDEARTPLIIGLEMPNRPEVIGLLRWAETVTEGLSAAADFTFDPESRRLSLTEEGCRRIVLWPKPRLIDSVETEKLYESVEQALLARLAFHLDRDYVIHDEEVSIVDESTGRVMEGRKWQDGLHQAIEVKERLEVTAATGEAARVTVQTFFREYEHLGGMTGTAVSAAAEFKATYRLNVARIPTHRPCLREGLPTRVFLTRAARNQAVAGEIERIRSVGRSILVGTPSVAASEYLGEALRGRGIPHQILNARNDADEAAIVADAGLPSRVTIATNMAGRGTDILLHPDVRQAGGLHIIATEMHSSARIDRQLVGRAARQGDPGSYQFFLSLEDELLRVISPQRMEQLRRQATADSRGEIGNSWEKLFQRTQATIERHDRKQRKLLLKREQQRRASHHRMGLDPCLELPE